MMSRLQSRAEQIARSAQRSRLARVADTLRATSGIGSAQIEGDQVVVRGRGLLEAWLTRADLRFLARQR